MSKSITGTTAYRVICWHANIKPRHRDCTTLSDGATFKNLQDAKALANRVALQGGKLLRIDCIENAGGFYESLAEYDAAGSMTADEIAQIGKRC